MALLVLAISCDDIMIITHLVTWSRQALSLPSDLSHRLTRHFIHG